MIPIATVEDIAENLGHLRRLRKLSQLAVGDDAGIGFTRVSKYERGVHVPDVSTLLTVLGVLGYQLAIVPLIETAPETALSDRLADQEAEIHTRVGVDRANGSTGLSGGNKPDPCTCDHDGLDPMFHTRPCPVAEARIARRRKTPPADSCTCVYRPNGGVHSDCPVHRGRRARGPKPPPVGPGCNCDGSGRTCPRHGAVI